MEEDVKKALLTRKTVSDILMLFCNHIDDELIKFDARLRAIEDVLGRKETPHMSESKGLSPIEVQEKFGISVSTFKRYIKKEVIIRVSKGRYALNEAHRDFKTMLWNSYRYNHSKSLKSLEFISLGKMDQQKILDIHKLNDTP